MINSMAAHGSFHENNFDPKDRVVELEKQIREMQSSVSFNLRDYFATKAMQGFAAYQRDTSNIAEAAYKMADAMLAAREK